MVKNDKNITFIVMHYIPTVLQRLILYDITCVCNFFIFNFCFVNFKVKTRETATKML